MNFFINFDAITSWFTNGVLKIPIPDFHHFWAISFCEHPALCTIAVRRLQNAKMETVLTQA